MGRIRLINSKKDKMFGEEDDGLEFKLDRPLTQEEWEDNINYLKNHPLFMKDATPEDLLKNETIQALQHIAYDDTPENIAKYCNDNANNMIKHRKGKFYIAEALKAYDEGIEQNCNDDELNAKLHCNRALVNIKLRNYRSVIEDCDIAIKLNPSFVKAYYRKAFANYRLEKFEECTRICDQGIQLSPTTEDLLTLRKLAIDKISKIEEKKKKELEEKAKENKALHRSCKLKGIVLGQKRVEIPLAYNQLLWIDEENQIHTPIVIYYPEFQQMDLIQDSLEGDKIYDHLANLLENGLPWDTKGHYSNFKDLNVFIEINTGKPLYMLKRNKKHDEYGFKRLKMDETVGTLLKNPDYIVPMVLEIYVLSERSHFFDCFKQSKIFDY